MVEACGTHEREQKCIQRLGKEETISKFLAYIAY
jgi:hypothetical protein